MSNTNEGNVFYIGDFDDSMERDIVIPLTKEIQKQRTMRDGRIDLHINSFGGYAFLAWHLVELVEIAKAEDITVRTIVMSNAFSAGSILAVTGTPGERYIAKTAEHLVHYGTTGYSSESTPLQLERIGDYKIRGFKQILAHYNKYCDIPSLDTEMIDDGYFIPAAKTIKFGMADKYLSHFDIGYQEV